MAYAGGAAAAAGAAAEEARKALVGGLLVEVDEEAFLRLASENRDRVCVAGEVGTIRKKMLFAFSIDGLVIMTKTDRQVPVPNKLIYARDISVPAI
jgi:hypothetical protein